MLFPCPHPSFFLSQALVRHLYLLHGGHSCLNIILSLACFASLTDFLLFFCF